jgi:hypothetical protein
MRRMTSELMRRAEACRIEILSLLWEGNNSSGMNRPLLFDSPCHSSRTAQRIRAETAIDKFAVER